jgi:hypothetical protein
MVGTNDPPARPQMALDFVGALARRRHGGRAQAARVAA